MLDTLTAPAGGALIPAHVSAKGRIFITQQEGRRLTAYRDSTGLPTIGCGHTSMAGPPAVVMGMTITNAECDEILARDLVKYENQVKAAVHVTLNQAQFDALVDFTYNEGQGTLQRVIELSGLNRGNYVSVPRILEEFTRAGGRDLAALVRRRRAEAAIFQYGRYPVGVRLVSAWRAVKAAVLPSDEVAA